MCNEWALYQGLLWSRRTEQSAWLIDNGGSCRERGEVLVVSETEQERIHGAARSTVQIAQLRGCVGITRGKSITDEGRKRTEENKVDLSIDFSISSDFSLSWDSKAQSSSVNSFCCGDNKTTQEKVPMNQSPHNDNRNPSHELFLMKGWQWPR